MVNVIYLAGLERSGTNYIQWLLKENFKNVIVITTFKHQDPYESEVFSKIDWNNKSQDMEELYNEVKLFADKTASIKEFSLPPLAFVSKELVPPVFGKKSLIVEKYVEQAIMNKTLKFLINVKNPYGWHMSYTKRWPRCVFPKSMKRWQDAHKEWDSFGKKYPNITLFVRHEDMLRDFRSNLNKMKDFFGLMPYQKNYLNVNGYLTSTSNVTKEPFNRRSYFMNEEYIKDLVRYKRKELDECRSTLSKQLVERFGYRVL
jgi:hypothetical protein